MAIEFRPDGNLLIGIRDIGGDDCCAEHGDLLPAVRSGDSWLVITEPEWYKDDTTHKESLWGGIATLAGLDYVVSTAVDPAYIRGSGGALWFSNDRGTVVAAEIDLPT